MRFLVLVFLSYLLGTCSPVPPDFVRKQEIKYARTEIVKLAPDHVEARIILRETNHDTVTLDDVWLNYELFIEGRKLGAGENVALVFRAKETTEIPIPITVRYADLFKTLENMTKAIASGKKSVPFRLRSFITIRFLGVPIEIPHEAEGQLPLPEVKLPRIKL